MLTYPNLAVYFNEWESYPARWLQNLYSAACVDDRSICEVDATDVAEYDRVHLFAGIGGWELALDLAEWVGPVWTGSCPCQPFSVAGKKRGKEDERHLWPEMFRLIRECRPPVVFGEQVAGKRGLEWFDGVRTDLEGIGYSCGMAVLPAASVGAPHRRERIFWVADADSELWNDPIKVEARKASIWRDHAKRRKRRTATEPPRENLDTPWSRCVWTDCADGKRRRLPPIESRILPMDARIPGDLGQLSAYGNTIVPQVAALFIRSFVQAKNSA